jgi:hypothetical protein
MATPVGNKRSIEYFSVCQCQAIKLQFLSEPKINCGFCFQFEPDIKERIYETEGRGVSSLQEDSSKSTHKAKAKDARCSREHTWDIVIVKHKKSKVCAPRTAGLLTWQ